MATHRKYSKPQPKTIIYDVYRYFKRLENCEEKVNVFFRETQKITAEACGVSRRTVQRICEDADKSAAYLISVRN